MQSVTRQLAEFISTHSLSDMPDGLRRNTGRIIADTVASIVSGAGSEVAPGLLKYASAHPGSVPVLGTAVTASAEAAALVNGAFGHALEYDDVFSMLPGHPAAIIIAALVPDLAARPVSARELSDAFIIGYEVCARFGISMTLQHHRDRGFHATATLGMFAGVAALARLRRLTTDQTVDVLSVAGSFASGILAQLGTSMKSVHSGWAARNAVAAADLAAAGITGAADILESSKGFYNAYGTAASKVGRLMENIANPWAIVEPGVSLKKYPCCFAAHRGIEAVLDLRRMHGVTFEEVAQIECRLPPKGLVNMVHHRPQTGLEAKFSMEYCFLATLVDGQPELSTFTDAQVLRPLIQSHLGMVTCIEDPACEEGIGEASGSVSGARGHVQITLILKDGRRLVQQVAHAPGTPMRELTGPEMSDKFAICARHAGMTGARVEALQAVLESDWQAWDDRPLDLRAVCLSAVDAL